MCEKLLILFIRFNGEGMVQQKNSNIVNRDCSDWIDGLLHEMLPSLRYNAEWLEILHNPTIDPVTIRLFYGYIEWTGL